MSERAQHAFRRDFAFRLRPVRVKVALTQADRVWCDLDPSSSIGDGLL
jgi:hypothetical protein